MLKYDQGVIDTEKQPALSHRLSAVAPAREVIAMYVTYDNLFSFCLVIIAVITLAVSIFNSKK